MTLETVLIWIVIGAISGWLASAVVGGGFGLIGDIIVGIVGAFIGSWLFREMHWHSPIAGIAGVIFVAFIGAILLLILLRIISRGRRRVLP